MGSKLQLQAKAVRVARKTRKRAAETSRMFIDVQEVTRRSQAVPLTRYVE